MLAHETGRHRGAARPASVPPALFSPREDCEGSEDLHVHPRGARRRRAGVSDGPARRPLPAVGVGGTVRGPAATAAWPLPEPEGALGTTPTWSPRTPSTARRSNRAVSAPARGPRTAS